MKLSLSKRLTIILLFTMFIAVMNIIIVASYQFSRKYDARIINLAGRQRLLSQRITQHAISIATGQDDERDDLKEAIDRYETTLKALRFGGVINDIKIPPVPFEMKSLFDEDAELWMRFKKHALRISETTPESKGFINSIKYIKATNNQLVNLNDTIAGKFEENFTSKYNHLRNLIALISIVEIIIFLIGLIRLRVLINPLKELTRKAERLGKGDFSQKIEIPQNNEIGDLAASFNRMAADLKDIVVSKDYLKGIFDAMIEALFVVDRDGVIKIVNLAACRMLALGADEIVSTQLNGHFSKPILNSDIYAQILTKGAYLNLEADIIRDSDKLPVLCNLCQMKKTSNTGDGENVISDDILVVATDISINKRQQAELIKLSAAVDQSMNSIMITDINGHIEYVNKKFVESTGYALDEIKGKTPRVLKSGKHSRDFYKLLWETITSGREFRTDICNKRKDGTLIWEILSISPIKDSDGNVTHFISVKLDDTERKESEERLKFYANFDPLTGIPNRRLYEERFGQALIQAQRYGGGIAAMLLDLDRFKFINDTLGHNIGDLLLKEVAVRLGICIRKSDTVARMGGDEFQIFLPNIKRPDDAVTVARKIITSLNEPFILNGNECFIGVSIGISLFPQDGSDTKTLIKCADIAMYKVKEEGKNNYCFYQKSMDAAVMEKLRFEKSIKKAIDNNEFKLYYQPQITLSTGRITGVESLLRWEHPEMGIISPAKFLPVAEDTGLIIPIGEWVIRTACKQWLKWREMGIPHFSIAVNISVKQLIYKRLADSIIEIINETGMDASALEIELVESSILNDVNVNIKVINELRSHGVRFAIDDFGTGYSSLKILKQFQIDTLKIDRTFIEACTTDKNNALMTSTMVNLAKNLDITVIAEGVETIDQLEYLRTLGCNAVQGHVFSKPQPEERITELLKIETV